MLRSLVPLTLALTLGLASLAGAQQPPEYGMPIDLATAKKIMSAAEAEAKRQNWPVAIAIVDTHGDLVMFQRLENTQYGSIQIAISKASTAARFRRESKVFESLLADGGTNLRVLKIPEALPLEGGLPIMIDGKVVGGIGVSGVKSTEDAMVGRAGLKAIEQ